MPSQAVSPPVATGRRIILIGAIIDARMSVFHAIRTSIAHRWVFLQSARMSTPDGSTAATASKALSPRARLSAAKFMLRALAHRNYRLFFLGQGVSLVGTWLSTT